MPRQKKTKSDTAAVDQDGEGEQAEMFPELDESDPKQKDLLRSARTYAKAKSEREALLSTSKEKCDGLMGKVIALMHQSSIKKFKCRGVKAELIETKEKVEVEIDDEGGDGSDDE